MMRVVVVFLGLLVCVAPAVRAEIVATADIVGRLAGPGPYTRPDGAGGVDVFWNVSTWNPYAVVLVRSNLRRMP